MDVLGYVRTLAWGPATEADPEPQEREIRTWAEARGHRLVSIVHDELVPGMEDLPHRLALGGLLEMLLEGSAHVLVVARLERLADDIVLQERLLAEIRSRGARLYSATPADEPHLRDEPADATRSAIRRVLTTSKEYERARRELRINRRMARAAAAGDRQQLVMAKIEALAEGGSSVDEISARLRADGFTGRAGYLFGRARLRRLLAVVSSSRGSR